MAFSEHFVTPSSARLAAARAFGPTRRLGLAGAWALLLSGGFLWAPGMAAAQGVPNLSGTWQLSCPNRKGEVRHVTLQIRQDGSKLGGRFSGPRRSGSLSGSVQGSRVSLKMGDSARSVSLTGTTDGNSMTVNTGKGASCSAARQ